MHDRLRFALQKRITPSHTYANVPRKREPIRRDLSMRHGRRKLSCSGGYGSPEFTNEVQHLLQGVLPWGVDTNNCHWTTAARLPSFKPPGARFGKSLQLWIARHRRSLVR